jgi:DNA-binding transcriptional LysR family regulator
MVRDELSVLAAFLAVAQERSFTRAARRLEVSPSALSHAIRRLEEQIGVRLLSRTTRSVAPTEAGEQLLASLRPALGEIRGALDRISGLRERPAGRVRLLVPRLAAMTVLAPKLGQFARDYQEGESHPKPSSPHDLTAHRCINFRHGSGGIYRWELDKDDQSLAVAVNGPLIVDDVDLLTRAAIDGVGLAFMSDEHAAPHLASGALARVLEDWCPPYPAALSALIETLRL